jgi:hypothetical protein
MNGFLRLGLCAAAAVILFSAVANADFIVQDNFHLGEADTGAILGGNAVNPGVDSGPGPGGTPKSLTLTGTPTYVAGAYAGSSMGVSFANPAGDGSATATQYYQSYQSGYLVGNPNYNWGVDFWFMPSAHEAGEHTVATFGGYGGSSTNNVAVEFELYGVPGGRLMTSDWGGRAFTADYLPPLDSWTHVVWVNNGGVGQLYINGTQYSAGAGNGQYLGPGAYNVANGGTYIPQYASPPNNVMLGGRNYSNTKSTGFNGAIDEVRVFTFAQGTFNIADTNPTPEPGTFALLTTGLLGMLAYAWRKRK